MDKTVFRPFWSYDVIKTEQWLSQMHSDGYALERIDFRARLFHFRSVEPAILYYRIVLDKKSSGRVPADILASNYEKVCFAENFYVVRTADQNAQQIPPYHSFLDRNSKIKFVTGIILLILLCLLIVQFAIVSVVFTLLMSFDADIVIEDTSAAQLTPAEIMYMIQFLITGMFILLGQVWLLYTYFKLRKTNRQLAKLCGETLDLSMPIPPVNFPGKEEEKALRKEHKIIRKTRIGWFYSPDHTEAWLEKMERQGFNLYRMSKTGNSFFFINGEPKSIKYCVDFQTKADPKSYVINMENSWRLVYRSSRNQSINVWSQEYTDSIPQFYCDQKANLKQAKFFALIYSLCFFPTIIFYIAMFMINSDYFTWERPLAIILPIILSVEFGFLAAKTIFYSLRVRKSVNQECKGVTP